MKIFEFKDGKKAYSTGNITVKVNKQEPIKVDEVKMDNSAEKEFFLNPDKYSVSKDKTGKGLLKSKKKA